MGLLEQTCVMATDEQLPKGKTTVGVGFDVRHLAPTPAQEAVTLVATLTEINGKQLQYFVEARDSKGVISSGKHFRGIVDRDKFLEKIGNRLAPDDSAPENASGYVVGDLAILPSCDRPGCPCSAMFPPN